MIELGQRVRFDALEACKNGTDRIVANTVGVIVYINEQHKWFSVKHSGNQRISFKFCEIGQNVHICK